MLTLSSLLSLFLVLSCSHVETKSKGIVLPFKKGTQFKVSQGPFGKASHFEEGNEYSWDFDVPYGTPVISVEDGTVIQIWAPRKGGACDPKYSNDAHNIKIEATDGTVAQYVHVKSKVLVGSKVRKGDVIAVTEKNGFICSPQLHFGIYKSRNHLYDSDIRETLPLFFLNLKDGKALEGEEYKVESLP